MAGGLWGNTQEPRGVGAPLGPGVGYRRILISILIRRFPHRILKMTCNVIAILRWQRCPGDGAPRPTFIQGRRDQAEHTLGCLVSFFGTRQAADCRHLRVGLWANRRSEPQKNESTVTEACPA